MYNVLSDKSEFKWILKRCEAVVKYVGIKDNKRRSNE